MSQKVHHGTQLGAGRSADERPQEAQLSIGSNSVETIGVEAQLSIGSNSVETAEVKPRIAPACDEISQPLEEETKNPTKAEIKQAAEKFAKKIKARDEDLFTVFLRFLELTGAFTSRDEIHQVAASVFADHSDLLEDFLFFLH